MPREPRDGVLERYDARPSLERSVSRPLTSRSSIKASRLLNTAAATLAAGVLTDSTAEHYRAGFHNRAIVHEARPVELDALFDSGARGDP